MSKFLYLDFEFTDISESKLKLVCLCTSFYDKGIEIDSRSFWLYDCAEGRAEATEYLKSMAEAGVVFVAYAMEAEARSIHSLLGYHLPIKAIDLYLEYRCLTNHSDKYGYGKQYINGQVIETTPPPLYVDIDDDDEGKHHKPQHSLASATYKMLGVLIDTKEKNDVRDIIIRDSEIELHRERIVAYCASDVENLRNLFSAIAKAHTKEGGWSISEYFKFALSRGEYAVCAAKMTVLGYPINAAKVDKFKSRVVDILKESVSDVLASSDEYKLFRLNLKTKLYSMNLAEVRRLIKATPHAGSWTLTDKKSLSTSKNAFSKFYTKETPGVIGAFMRYLSLKQSLNGFLPGAGKAKKFHEFVGRDNRVRYFQGIYGSQSSRSQPGASGFIPLKAHWMRNFIEPLPGRAIVGIDYASQEFLLAAVLSQDDKMLEAYASGDIYLAFAKSSGLAPSNATKSTHKSVRDLCKALVLGISYDMGKDGLAQRMSSDTGKIYTPSQAERLIEVFYETYPDYAEWKSLNFSTYKQDGYLSLPDGWTMWGDNPNYRSVGNFPVQGLGAVIMRDAVKRAFAAGLDVIYTLHDALYVEYDSFNFSAIKKLRDCMTDAYEAVAKTYGKYVPIRLEGDTWSLDYDDTTDAGIPDVVCMKEYMDARGAADFERFNKYFT